MIITPWVLAIYGTILTPLAAVSLILAALELTYDSRCRSMSRRAARAWLRISALAMLIGPACLGLAIGMAL